MPSAPASRTIGGMLLEPRLLLPVVVALAAAAAVPAQADADTFCAVQAPTADCATTSLQDALDAAYAHGGPTTSPPPTRPRSTRDT